MYIYIYIYIYVIISCNITEFICGALVAAAFEPPGAAAGPAASSSSSSSSSSAMDMETAACGRLPMPTTAALTRCSRRLALPPAHLLQMLFFCCGRRRRQAVTHAVTVPSLDREHAACRMPHAATAIARLGAARERPIASTPTWAE